MVNQFSIIILRNALFTVICQGKRVEGHRGRVSNIQFQNYSLQDHCYMHDLFRKQWRMKPPGIRNPRCPVNGKRKFTEKNINYPFINLIRMYGSQNKHCIAILSKMQMSRDHIYIYIHDAEKNTKNSSSKDITILAVICYTKLKPVYLLTYIQVIIFMYKLINELLPDVCDGLFTWLRLCKPKRG